MKIVINNNGERIPATLEVVDGVMIISAVNGNDISQFKGGDIITCGWDGKNKSYSWTCVLRGKIERIVNNLFIEYYCVLNCHSDYSCENGYSDSATYVRYATEEEKQKLFDTLAKEGKAWDAEKKAVVDLKWRPYMGEIYYSPLFYHYDYLFKTYDYTWRDLFYDNYIYNKGWCFKTKDECQEFCNRLNDTINSVKP